MSYADRLSRMDDAWGKAQVDSRGLPPDGDYQAMIDRFDFIDSSNGLLLKTELHITQGDYEGMRCSTIHNLEQSDRLEPAKRHLAALNALPQKLSDLERVLPSALDALVEVTVKTAAKTDEHGNHYRNLYVNKVLAHSGHVASDVPSGFEPVEQSSTPAEDASIPF